MAHSRPVVVENEVVVNFQVGSQIQKIESLLPYRFFKTGKNGVICGLTEIFRSGWDIGKQSPNLMFVGERF